jgi:hypothetical protein
MHSTSLPEPRACTELKVTELKIRACMQLSKQTKWFDDGGECVSELICWQRQLGLYPARTRSHGALDRGVGQREDGGLAKPFHHS